jgi:hypothetical protein
MTLGDLLEELRDNILHDRSDQVSGASDYLWSDKTLIRYINEAQRRFARLGLVLRDASTPQCCTVKLASGQIMYPLDPSVVAVISAQYTGDPGDLARAGHAALSTYHTPDPYFFNPAYLSTLPPGKPLAYSTDEEVRPDENGSLSVVTMRVYPAPLPTYVAPLKLRVARLPINKLCELADVPEIPEDHHIDMLDWAAYRALRIVDHDKGDAARAAEFQAAFAAHVEEAKKTAQLRMFVPMQFGFGRNGFNWDT